MTSKMLYVAGMKTESEFADVYLDFIRSATLGELLPELKHLKQLALESTGIFAGQSQELDFTLSSINTL
jgi:hypothetical protein